MAKTINPHNLKAKDYKNYNQTQVRKIIKKAQSCYLEYQNSKISDRKKYLNEVKRNLINNKEKYAKILTNEMGKPINQAIAEIEKCAKLCDYYSKNTAHALEDHEIETSLGKSYTTYRPLGIVLTIMPWNFPFWQVFRAAVPALMAGNTVILKHASNVSGASLQLEKIFGAFPSGAFQSIILSGKNTDAVISHELIQKVTFTGSTTVGCEVAQIAGASLKPVVLELGGNDAYLVLEDADIDHAVDNLMAGRMNNNGQSCIAAKRWLIHSDIYKEFVQKATQKLNTLKIGNPMKAETDLGPVVSAAAKKDLEYMIKLMIKEGQKVTRGNQKLPAKGYYMLPALVEVQKTKKMYNNLELFGPVALIYKCRNLDEMLSLANDSDYGLGSGVYTKNKAKGQKIAQSMLESGSSFVNHYVVSDPALPFGGIKKSGFGRELATQGLHTFSNIKTIVVSDQ